MKNGTQLARGGATAINRRAWHLSAAQCVHMDVGWIKSTVKVMEWFERNTS